MRILFSIILLIFTSGEPIDFDLGEPEIQAVCKVTLNDGKIIEGFITFGGGGYTSNYRPHGFCFVHEDGTRKLILYGFRFNLSNRKETSKLFYVENISKKYYEQPKTEFDEEKKILTITNTDVEKYKFLEEMVIYKKLPLNLLVGYGSNDQNGKITIAVDKIRSIELLKKPSKSSLEIIEAARIKQGQSEKEKEWVDYQPPVWYHEIITNQEKINYLSKFF